MNTGVEKRQDMLRKMGRGENKMHTSEEGISLIKKFEGCRLEPYFCSANVLTIGYGHTRTAQSGQNWSQDHAEEMLKSDLEEFEGYVEQLVEVPLSQYQFDSLVAWCFNLGPANLKSSTLLKVLNSGAYEEVPSQIKRWNKAGGKVLEGLIRRREAEALLFQGEDWSHI